jgi:5-methylcytosine-specific restriction enzyme subunit McrC
MAPSQNSVSFTEYGIPIRNLWHMLLYAWNEASMLNQISMGEVENAPTLDALLALVLIKFLQQRMRIGLGQGYMDTSKRMRAVHGRVHFTTTMLDQVIRNGEVECDFQQYSVNEPRNRIIRSTLARLVQAGAFGADEKQAESLRHRLRWLVRNLEGVELVELNVESIRRLIVGQNENDYRLMLSICELIVTRQMPLEVEGTHPLPRLDRDMLILHRIYERFVANFYRMHLKDWAVNAQKRLDWHAQDANEHLPSMIPDLILQEQATGKMIILDTKFTANSLLENQWGKPVHDSSHLYQLYAYLRSQEELSAGYRTADGILLYPAVNSHLSERIQLQDHMIRIESVNLAAHWEEIEHQLLEIMSG